MKNEYFTETDTLFEITEKYPETIAVFAANGFPQMEDTGKRGTFGKNITLKTALIFQNRDYRSFEKIMIGAIEKDRVYGDITLDSRTMSTEGKKLHITGLLPCPVRIPLLEAFGDFASRYEAKTGILLDYDLRAASMGLAWIDENLGKIEKDDSLPDLFISAGFDLFFDPAKFGKLKESGTFRDLTGRSAENPLFRGYGLSDPKGHYSVIAVVPAVFLVNTEELKGRDAPNSWEDLLRPEYENSVSLPIGDFDLFNAILLNIEKEYGGEGVRKLGRSLLDSLHPSEMVKSGTRQTRRPAVTIMPYFFTKTIREGGPMQAVWPEDGAILSPIFMLAKASSAEETKPVCDFFASSAVGEILAHNGLFPSTHPDVDNRIPEGRRFMWPGWDYFYSINVAEKIKNCEELFHSSVTQGAAI